MSAHANTIGTIRTGNTKTIAEENNAKEILRKHASLLTPSQNKGRSIVPSNQPLVNTFNFWISGLSSLIQCWMSGFLINPMLDIRLSHQPNVGCPAFSSTQSWISVFLINPMNVAKLSNRSMIVKKQSLTRCRITHHLTSRGSYLPISAIRYQYD